MTLATNALHVKGLGRQTMTRLASKAKSLGITPERYVRALVEEDLALDQAARTSSLQQLMGRGHDVNESELGRLVDAARSRHHRRMLRKK